MHQDICSASGSGMQPSHHTKQTESRQEFRALVSESVDVEHFPMEVHRKHQEGKRLFREEFMVHACIDVRNYTALIV